MSKTLIIAEKPSVATDLARVLGKIPEVGKFERKKDYFENDFGFVSSAVGHLVELKMPEGPNGKKLPWGMKHLPVIPERFELQPIEKSESRFKLLQRLLKKKEVTTVVNACDAGREGELIFRYLLELATTNKKLEIRRMWMQSMTDGAILEAWETMRSDEEMRPLAEAAMCRSESDWLIGLNGTRALTAFNSRNGGFNVTTAGRVQTPTLVILAEREREIRSFVPRTYYEVHSDFGVAAGSYEGLWINPNHKKDEEDSHKKAERIWDKAQAEEIKARCEGKTGRVEEEKKESKEYPKALFDLTSLQREASGKHSYSARRTLQLAQACYDRYKILTYPRTDSKFLPEDYVATVQETIAGFAKAKAGSLDDQLVKCSKWIVDNQAVKPVKKVFNSAKVSDHFAIIPTGKLPPKSLDDDARKIYELVLKRFLAVFFPPAVFENTTRLTHVGEDTFRTRGKILVTAGFLEVYGRKPGTAGGDGDLVRVDESEQATVSTVELKEKETKPPARFNDASLLGQMETAGKRVDDEELRDAMSERGLGTPATRASIIEGLIRTKYIFRDDRNPRDFVTSNKGLALVDLIEEIGIDTIASPQMTGEWEYKLKEMEAGRLDRKEFMDEILNLTKSIVEQTREFTDGIVNRTFPDIIAPCPECENTEIKQTDGTFECKNPECSFRIKKHIASHELTANEAAQLIETKRIGPIETFKNRFGQPFTAELTLAKQKRTWKIDFRFEGDDERESEVDLLTDEQIICEAPLEEGSEVMVKVYENERAYLAPDMAKKAEERGVRVGKTILQKEIPRDQAVKLFTEGKTDLMPGFISKKRRPFAAHLLLNKQTGKLTFEFAPRKPKKKKGEKEADKEADKEPEKDAAADKGDSDTEKSSDAKDSKEAEAAESQSKD